MLGGNEELDGSFERKGDDAFAVTVYIHSRETHIQRRMTRQLLDIARILVMAVLGCISVMARAGDVIQCAARPIRYSWLRGLPTLDLYYIGSPAPPVVF